MTEPITTRILIERLHARLGLEWIGGLEGQNREIKPFTQEETGVALIGHLNLIHPNKVQVLGSTELEYLQNLDADSYQDTVNKLFSDTLSILIVASNQELPDEFILLADKKQTPLLRTPMASHNLITHIRYFLGSMLAEKTTLHGVFMEVMGNGVLLTGESGIGKSELALELISRGHRLVADDAPEFSRIAPDIINGTCPEILSELLEVRGLGILNIRSLFGDSAI
ncbi:MAG: HPr(Ser) kinase/phosphatase, partial [Gammaproteobacteria bacterium]|nr:HPr(Ser) kinase/phosphatase [Gammaproteobacteria bacterium]